MQKLDAGVAVVVGVGEQAQSGSRHQYELARLLWSGESVTQW